MSSRVLAEFDLEIPQNVDGALEALDSNTGDVTVISGGTDMLVALKFGFETDNAISLSALKGMDYLEFDEQKGLRVGARTTIAQLLKSEDVLKHYPAIWQAAKVFATPQLRNTATLVGNLLRGSPAGDCSCAAYALGASLIFASKSGQREVGVDEMWPAYGQTARQPNELALELRIPAPKSGSCSAFKRLTRVNEDLAKLNVAANLEMDGDRCVDARLTMGCVGPTLLRLPTVEALLKGQQLTDDVLNAAVAAVNDDITPIDDQRSTAEYRRDVAPIYLKRTILLALGRSE